jgi:hypothetical protein
MHDLELACMDAIIPVAALTQDPCPCGFWFWQVVLAEGPGIGIGETLVGSSATRLGADWPDRLSAAKGVLICDFGERSLGSRLAKSKVWKSTCDRPRRLWTNERGPEASMGGSRNAPGREKMSPPGGYWRSGSDVRFISGESFPYCSDGYVIVSG